MNNAQTYPMPVPGAGPAEISLGPRLISAAATAGRDLAYLIAVFAMSIVGFAVWVAGVSLTLGLLVLVIGALVGLATGYVLRGTTLIDRRLAGWLRREPIHAVYRAPVDPGLQERLRAMARDPQTWRDLAWLVVNSITGFALSLASLVITTVVLAYVAMPAWWWAIPDLHTQYGTLNLGIYTVTSTGWAFLTTAIGLVLLPVALGINHAAASGHAALAARLLGPSDSEQLERIERDLHASARQTMRKARDEALG